MLKSSILSVMGMLALTVFAAVLTGQTGSKQRIIVIAHRGEHLDRPENTLPAFQAAIDAGADFFELDVRTTADGHLILMHDASVDRTTNGTGLVRSLTLAQIRALDAGGKFSPAFAGTRMPTFEEALELARGKIGIYVDTKDADPKLLVDTIYRHHMERHVVIYGSPSLLQAVRKIQPALRVMPEARTVANCALLIGSLHPEVIAFGDEDFSPDIIACAKRGGAKVYVDRLGLKDDPGGWQSAIDMGADGIQTNRPAELVKYLQNDLTRGSANQ